MMMTKNNDENCNSNAVAADTRSGLTKSQSRGASSTWKHTICRESLLDIHGNPAPTMQMKSCGSSSLSSKDMKQTEARRLGNIFMKPFVINKDYQYPRFEKLGEERSFIENAIEDNFIFTGISSKDKARLLDAFEKVVVVKGAIIIREGEVGDYFYIVMDGEIEFTVNLHSVGHAKRGDSFGDLALLYDCARAATCTATTDTCILWRVDQKSFRQIIATGRLHGDQEIINVLQKVSILSKLSREYLAKIACAVTTKRFFKGDKIIEKGDPGTEFYILKDGSVLVCNIEAGGEVFSDQIYKKGDFFGERSIITNEPRAANVIAVEDCTAFCLSRVDFLQIIGPLDKLLKRIDEMRVMVSVLVEEI